MLWPGVDEPVGVCIVAENETERSTSDLWRLSARLGSATSTSAPDALATQLAQPLATSGYASGYCALRSLGSH